MVKEFRSPPAEHLDAANDNWQSLPPEKNAELIKALHRMMDYFQGLTNWANERVVSQRVLRQTQEDLQKESTEHLANLAINSSKPDWQSRPSFYTALMFVLHSRADPGH